MKQINNTTENDNSLYLKLPLFCSLLIAILLFSSCQKSELTKQDENSALIESAQSNADFISSSYKDISFQTAWELQQARAATAKYQHVEKAIADGYADIAVDVEHMGHHYMNAALLDDKFDIRHPEILVYNRDANGVQQLVAVEYAIPLNQPEPEGFTGSNDVWDGNVGFGLWLCHAWVWSKNPDGVFKPFNPLIELH